MRETISKAVQRARLQLMLGHPFLAAAMARYPLVDAIEHPWCETMATDGYYIYVNRAFAESLSEAEIIGVLGHEVLHCVLGHIDRRGEREREVWNMAIDYATNLFLTDCGFTLPANGLLDNHFKGMTSEDIYDRLMATGAQSGEASRGGPGGGSDKQRSHPGGDHHVDPADPEGLSKRAQDFPSEQERRRVRRSLAKEMANQLPGSRSGFLKEEIRQADTAHISWQQILANFFNGLRRSDYRMFPPNKKHAWRGIYLPSLGTPGPEHIVVAIDTSGSMNTSILSKVLAEIDRLRSITECKLTLIECDTEIKKVEQFEAWDLTQANFKRRNFRGRGGTDLRVPFDWVNENIIRNGESLDGFFYMTDGYGPMPESAGFFPTYWIVPRHMRDEFPFGQVLRMS
jgi:predicted metal-dependent peptidase